VPLPPPLSRREHAIVLVHGAWVGEWSWSPVLPLLEASGRPVHAVSLTGHGARRHESGPHVTLATHVADVVGVIETHDLTDITLVGHSYGGRVITAAYAQLADRVSRLVYLDGHAPLAPDTGQTPERFAQAEANGGMLLFEDYDPDPAEVGGPDGVAWFMARVMPQSFATFASPLGPPLPDHVDKTYVYASGSQPSRFTRYADAAAAHPAWHYVELAGSHWLMFTHPTEVTEIILRVAG
jgi:pimeloyl-ACP methyl ester carboxylesterase